MQDMGFKWIVFSRIMRSIGIIFITLSSSLYLNLIHVSLVLIGVVFLGVIGFNSALSLTLGIIGDRYGYKKSLIIGESISTIGTFLFALSTNFYLITASLMIAGIGGAAGGMRGVYSPGLSALVVSNWPNERERVRRMGILTSSASLASIAGSSMLILHNYLPFGSVENYRVLFLLSSFFLLASLLSIINVKENPRPRKTSKVLSMSSLRYVYKVMITNALAGFGIGLAIPLLPLWFEIRYGVNSSDIGVVFTLSYLFTSFGSFLATRIHLDVLKVASVTRVMNGIFLILMALSPWFVLASALYLIRGMNAGMGAPNRTAVNIRGVKSEDFGAASSIEGLATRGAQMSSGLSGALMEMDLLYPLFLGGIIQAISGILYLTLLKKPKEESTLIKRQRSEFS
ncbi:MFS transporter [Sulfuracidifex metallicus]|uniref:MFS transporter n=1 Tax=Sulfuracidifex metallicus DSM 6482 = JCM 9184 TaxID=523847 RepID=A0A6A9QJF9_SULME|nr:MFS transporter [Sulfuracidifex metallicus]MUN28380.1 MFS transporter [Sulfuracidifex metallicus DSM 6482 = JCM 9184]